MCGRELTENIHKYIIILQHWKWKVFFSKEFLHNILGTFLRQLLMILKLIELKDCVTTRARIADLVRVRHTWYPLHHCDFWINLSSIFMNCSGVCISATFEFIVGENDSGLLEINNSFWLRIDEVVCAWWMESVLIWLTKRWRKIKSWIKSAPGTGLLAAPLLFIALFKIWAKSGKKWQWSLIIHTHTHTQKFFAFIICIDYSKFAAECDWKRKVSQIRI